VRFLTTLVFVSAAFDENPLAGILGPENLKQAQVAGVEGYDGENYNLGFVARTGLPYPETVSFAKAAHRRMYAAHAWTAAPVTRSAK